MGKSSEDNKIRRIKFLQSNFCIILVLILGLLFAFGSTCVIWKYSTKSLVYEGNVFGYSTLTITDTGNTPTYNVNDRVILNMISIDNLSAGNYIAYNTGNSTTTTYKLGKVSSIDLINEKIYVTDNTLSGTETYQINASMYVGVVCVDGGMWVNIVEVLNSYIMLLLFVFIFGLLFLLLLIFVIQARKN